MDLTQSILQKIKAAERGGYLTNLKNPKKVLLFPHNPYFADNDDNFFTQPPKFLGKPQEFVLREAYNDLKEDNEFVPKFSLKNVKDFSDVPINKPIKYDEKIFIKAIKYG